MRNIRTKQYLRVEKQNEQMETQTDETKQKNAKILISIQMKYIQDDIVHLPEHQDKF